MTDAPQPCDLLIEAGWVVPVAPHGVVLEDHAVAVRDGAVVAVLPRHDARVAFTAREVVSRPGAALIPGLVNAHTHNPMVLMRGVADDLPLMQWLQGHIWPLEAQLLGPEFIADGVALAIAEMLRGGTTCCNENYFFPDVQAATYRRFGFRALVGLPIIDFPSAWARSDDEYFDRAGEVHDQWRNDPLVATGFAPHAPYTVSDASFERIRMLSDQLDIPVHCHVHETAHEVAESQQKHGQRPLARLDRLGLVNDRLIAVHMTQLNEAEIALCAARGVARRRARSWLRRSRRLHRAGQAGGPRVRRPRRARNAAAAPRDLAAGVRVRPPPGHRRVNRGPAPAARARAGRHGRSRADRQRATVARAHRRDPGVLTNERGRTVNTIRADNFSQAELDKFNELAHRWWDPEGPQKALHALNPVRLRYVADRVHLRDAEVLDVGCGGGLLSEALAGEGARVTAIDLAPDLLKMARLHGLESGVRVDYRLVST